VRGKSAAFASPLEGIAQTWLAGLLSRIADHKITRIDELLPWRYAATTA
jgi:hypothetical protein